MTTVICVLNSGGGFTPRDVDRLYHLVFLNATIPFSFICLTDIPEQVYHPTLKLESNFPGWWAKLEIFRFPGPVIYFDLDTIILKNIDKLFELVTEDKEVFYMLRGVYKRKSFMSGIMLWNGNFNHILRSHPKNINPKTWEQEHIVKCVREKRQILVLNDHFPGIVSYKVQGVSSKSSIVLFHGRPRVYEIEPFWEEQVHA